MMFYISGNRFQRKLVSGFACVRFGRNCFGGFSFYVSALGRVATFLIVGVLLFYDLFGP